MLSEAQALPEDPAQLREAAEGLVSLVKSQALRIAKLEHQLAGLRRHRFGSTSESLDQLQLGLEDEEIAAAQAAKAVPLADPTVAPKGVPKRKPLPVNLPRQETVLSLGDPARRAAAAGSRRWARMSPKSWTMYPVGSS
jgi:transposase